MEEEPGCLHVKQVSGHTWYGDDSPHLSVPHCHQLNKGDAPGCQARAGENGQYSVEWAAAHPGQDRRLPSVATHTSKALATPATKQVDQSEMGIVRKDGSRFAVDWVTAVRTPTKETA